MITYDSVNKVFGSGKDTITALRNINFTVDDGDVVVLLGPSGCGKTTTLRLTNRLETLTSGSIRVDDRDISNVDPVKLRQSMGYVIQEIGLFPNKTIGQNIAVVPSIMKWDRARINERIDELLNMVNLDPDVFRDRYPAELSGGQQQRVGVARGLAADPDILLMDEPFGAIDPINREYIQDEFLRLQAKLKKTVLFVSHDIHEAIKVGDKIALFQEGELVQYDTAERLLTQPANQFVADFVGADRALKVLGLKRVADAVDRSRDNVVTPETTAEAALAQLDDAAAPVAVMVEADRPVGYLTRTQLERETGPVAEFAHDFKVKLEMDSPLRDALSYMLMHDTRALCVVDADGHYAGTLSYAGIQHALLGVYAEGEHDGGD